MTFKNSTSWKRRLKELNTFLWMWLQELNLFFLCDSKIWTFSPIIEKNVSKNSTFLKKVSKIFLKKYHSNFRIFLWLKEFNFFSTWLTEIEPFFSTWPKVLTYLFWKIWLKELNFIFKQKWHNELNLKGKMTQRIELLQLISLKELNFFFMNMAQIFCSFNMTLGIDFFTITPRIELFSYDSKNCE